MYIDEEGYLCEKVIYEEAIPVKNEYVEPLSWKTTIVDEYKYETKFKIVKYKVNKEGLFEEVK